MIKRFIIVGVILGFLIFAVFGFQEFRSNILKKVFDEMVQPPASITTTHAKKEKWAENLKAIASLAPLQGVEISAEEPGKVIKIVFESGTFVKKETPLLQQEISVEESQLRSNEAQWKLAEQNVKRAELLFKEQAMTQAELDEAQSKFQQLVADHQRLRSLIDRKTIRAPFSGRLGIRHVQLGQYLNPGNLIVSLQAMDPLYVNFTLPQIYLNQIKINQSFTLLVDAYPQEKFTGFISAIEPQIDLATRNIKLQGTLQNPEEKLRPGMFATVQLSLGSSIEGFVVPQTAIQYAPYGDSVFIVEAMTGPDGKIFQGVRQQFVKLGPTRGDLVTILDGLKEGEEIATTGVFKLRPKVPVSINNQIQPQTSQNPTPENQ